MNGGNVPKVTVLMPVYNAERYLREAVDSILSQTFDDFELLVIDDGSSDKSLEIVRSYHDQRIVCLTNPVNRGLVVVLNRGLAHARGKYLAIMHADDISMPNRLEQQVDFLDHHPNVSLVATKSVLIDAAGEETGLWQADQDVATAEQIRTKLPEGNCISHPSIMMRTAVGRAYGYDSRHHATEDYDLWLRLVADGHCIEKLDQNLLKYRVHGASITASTYGDHYKEVRARAKFLLRALQTGKAKTVFHLLVLYELLTDLCEITVNILKVRLLALAKEFFIAVGRLCGCIFARVTARYSRKNTGNAGSPLHRVIIFLAYSPQFIGGAERVHAEIISANLDKCPWVVLSNEWFDEISIDKKILPYKFSIISKLLRNPITKNLLIGFFAGYINRVKCAVFGGNTVFFYQLLEYLRTEVFCVDFVHGFDEQLEKTGLGHVQRIDRRIVISPEIYRSLFTLYKRNEIPDVYVNRIRLLHYGVDVPSAYPLRTVKSTLTIMYVGRGTDEKRVYLVGRMARYLAEQNFPVEVWLVGDVQKSVEEQNRAYCRFFGPVSDRNYLEYLYDRSDILVITSRTEGLCLAKLEAMAHGVVPIGVAVGGIPDHIQDGVTGFLVSPDQSEERILSDFCDVIIKLCNDKEHLQKVSTQAYEFARQNFNKALTDSCFLNIFASD